MSETMEKYVAKALEGYEQNHAAVTNAIEQLEGQLTKYKEQQEEMANGISEMKEELGLSDEDTETVEKISSE